MSKCYFCGTEANETAWIRNGASPLRWVECGRCGTYAIASWISKFLNDWTQEERMNASSFLRQSHVYEINTHEKLNDLRTIRSPGVGEKARRLFEWIVTKNRRPGQRFPICSKEMDAEVRRKFQMEYTPDARSYDEMMAKAWILDDDELRYVTENVLIGELGWLDEVDSKYRVTPKGWAVMEGMLEDDADKGRVFVAMSFAAGYRWVFTDIIKLGAERAGYEAFRMMDLEHNRLIDDYMVAQIRRSRFMIAEFSGGNRGAYFEAGFAMALGKEVVRLVEERQLNRVHFDKSHYNFVTWRKGDVEAAREALAARIERSLGRGPVRRA